MRASCTVTEAFAAFAAAALLAAGCAQAAEIRVSVRKPSGEPVENAVVVAVPVGGAPHVRHQVYSFSPAKVFELPLYAGTQAKPVVFDKPGVVVLGCNIHDWMVGYVYVSESPWFVKTAADGTAVLRELPPRHYTVRVWHPLLEGAESATQQMADLAAAGSLDMSWDIKLRTEIRIRRAPATGSHGHY
jgi:hypothetical protein